MSITSRRSGGKAARLSLSRLAIPAGIVAMGALAVIALSDIYAPQPASTESASSMPAPQRMAKASPYNPLLDPGYSLGAPPQTLKQAPPFDAGFRASAVAPKAPAPTVPAPFDMAAVPDPVQATPPAQLALPPLPLDKPRIVADAPRPIPRPTDLNPQAAPERPRAAERPSLRRNRTAAAAAATPEDNRSFFEKLFGVERAPASTALAYAAPQDDIIDAGRGRRLSPLVTPAPSTAQATAIYDISARTVYMPNGEKLEAHSGLGEHMDDPSNVHLRMRGATPPHTYTLSMREALFHGVRALRLNPVGGSAAIYGRAGLLTHTYLLGPNGDSNGCVSFKDYDKFLQAYLRGEVKRLVVVAGRG